MSTAPATRWLAWPPDRPTAMPIFCFPPAGGGAATYRPWRRALPASVAAVPVLPPGRESRLREEPLRQVWPLVDELVPALEPHTHRPFAFFGHSLGALVAFETARALRRAGLGLPVHVMVSGRAAPQLPNPRPPAHPLPDGALVERLRALGGTPDEVLAQPRLLATMFPALRADFAVNENYVYRDEPPLPVPLTALAGTRDAWAPPVEVAAWRAQTSARFALHMVAGGHSFIATHPAAVLAHVERVIRPWSG